MWELLAPQKITCITLFRHQGIKERMGVGRGYREPHVRCVCLMFVLNQNDSGTVASPIYFDSSLCKIFIPSLIPSFALLFIIQCLP